MTSGRFMTWDKLEPVNHSGVTIIGLKKVSKLNYKSVLCGVANSVHRINLLKVFQQAKLSVSQTILRRMFRQVLAITLLVAVSNIEGRSHRQVFANPILRTLYNFPRNAAATCNKPVDLGFALDKTGQNRNDNFDFAKTFAKALVSKFEISDQGAHIGAVAFDDSAQILLLFNDLKGSKNNPQSVKKQIDSWGAGSPGANVMISEGLIVADDFLFTEENGMRSGVKKALVVLTDGKQDRDQEAMHNSAQDLRNSKEVNIFPVGIGRPDPVELLYMAGFQNADNVVKLNNETMIEEKATEVAKLICQ